MQILGFFEKLYEKLFVKKGPKKDFSPLKDEHKLMLGDCIIFETDALVADGIEWFSGGKVSHVALYVGGGNRNLVEALIKGVKIRTLDTYFTSKYTIHVRRIKGLTVEQAEKMKTYAYSRVGKPYDIKQFLTLALYFICKKFGIRQPTIVANSDVKDICSELYFNAAMAVGIRLIQLESVVVTPHNLLECTTMVNVIKV